MVDGKGVAHVVAADYKGVKYSYGKGTSHSVGPILTTDNSANHPSVAVDDKGAVHVIWATKNQVWLSKLQGSAWSQPTKISDSSINSPTAIAMDSNSDAHVAFRGCAFGKCGARYGIQVQGGWSLQTLGSKSGVKHLAVALSSKDEVAVVVGTQSDGVDFYVP